MASEPHLPTHRFLKEKLGEITEKQLDHDDYSTLLGSLNLSFGFFAAALAVIGGSGSLASAETVLNIPTKTVFAVVSIIAGLITAAITTYNFSDRAEKHRIASADYADLRNRIQELIDFPPISVEEAKKAYQEINKRQYEIETSAPKVYSHFILIWSRRLRGVSR